jgi:hypothetical protein
VVTLRGDVGCADELQLGMAGVPFRAHEADGEKVLNRVDLQFSEIWNGTLGWTANGFGKDASNRLENVTKTDGSGNVGTSKRKGLLKPSSTTRNNFFLARIRI